jgi:hypothetical protein
MTRLLAIEEDARAIALLRGSEINARCLRGVVVEAASETRAEVILDDLAVVLGTPLVPRRERVVECLTTSDPADLLRGYALPEPVGIGSEVPPGRRCPDTASGACGDGDQPERVGTPITFVDGAAHDFFLHPRGCCSLARVAGPAGRWRSSPVAAGGTTGPDCA